MDQPRRALVALLCTIAIPFAFTACGGDDGSDKAAAGEGSPAASNEPVTLNWESWKPLEPEAKQLIAEFQKDNPNVTIKYKFLQYPDYIKDLKLKMASGEGPDIFFGQSGAMVGEYAEFAEDLAPYAEKQWGAGWKDRFYPLGLEQTTIDGRTAGLPWQLLSAGTLWYNKDLFDAAGISAPPTTYDELKDAVAKLQSSGVTPFVQGAKDNWINFDMFMALANQFAPGAIQKAQDGETSWTDAGLVQAMEQWKALFDDGIMQKGALTRTQYPDAATEFYKGKAAMIMQGSWEVGNLVAKAGRPALEEAYGVKKFHVWRPFPFPDVDGDGQPAPLTGGPDAIAMINADSEHVDAAWKFVAFLMEDPGQEYLTDHLIAPSVKGYELDPSKAARTSEEDVLQQTMDGIGSAQFPRELNYPELQEALGRALQEVASGQKDAAAALESVQQASDRIRR